MPILANAKKALRQSHKKAAMNTVVKSKARTSIKTMKTTPTAAHLQVAFSTIDKAVKHNLVHKNKAARLKSQLSKLVAA